MKLLKNLLLVLGGAVIVIACLFTLSHLTDRVVVTVLVPGVVFGLILIVLSLRLGPERWR